VDTILGWGAIIGFIAVVACLFVPMPWGALAPVAVVGITVLLLRARRPAPEHSAR